MEKNDKKLRTDIDVFLKELESDSLADYHNFNLEALAQKIKMQTYRPKPKMLYL